MRYDVVFDLDDTLIVSFPGYVRVHQQVAQELGWDVPTEADLIHYRENWRATLDALFPGREIEAFVARYNELADHVQYPAMPGALATLDALAHAGDRLWLLTKRSRKRLPQRMAQAGIAPERFAGIYCQEDVPAQKPDPRCFEPMWSDLGGPPEAPGRILYVGDRREDAGAARSAGIHFVAVRTGPEATLPDFPPAELAPEDVVDSVAALPAYLDTWSPT